MEIQYLEIGLGILGAVIANYGVKLVRVYPLLRKAHSYAREEAEARKDGVLTEQEKAALYDEIEGLVREAWRVMKGFFPNKSA